MEDDDIIFVVGLAILGFIAWISRGVAPPAASTTPKVLAYNSEEWKIERDMFGFIKNVNVHREVRGAGSPEELKD